MPDLILTNARIPGYVGLQQLTIQDEVILSLQPQSSMIPAAAFLDLQGDWISLGGIDLQINGALGLAFPDLDFDTASKLEAINQFLWQHGVDGYLPTLVTTSVDNIQRSLSILATPSSRILGVHLEGPFLNPAKQGAHPAEYLLPLTLDTVRRVLGDYASLVKVMTLAPELDETGEVIPYLRSLGITVSLGHSLATAAQAQRAFDQGATMVTHAFNAMPSLHHREPGLLGAAIAHPQVRCGLIADGQHVSPVMIDILLRASNYEQGIFLVSDALSPLGLPDGIYPWDTRQIEVTDGTARLLDGTLSGTTLPLLVGAQNLVKWGCDVEQAIALATSAPRRAIGLSTDYIGQPASLLRWHQSQSGELQWERLGNFES
ncbi:N-acetylglucosamine-6-phosphate deacetylase [Phormidium sp. CLA17]|uniref:N-acetylglucosamine-6-phosphate deacetylase n=1 Tax=Leptolyngbya sp. Cla-17 TaxID=2803751 RepID=UPI001491DC68|nr:N-acetylglucosamine-6-phosphate deacetylase [Leptolyngbya sp. Cla-17]MBM0743275.1 N-acetylglucosamine-6-phosphate deacetylase [Leptolyngbya sp. Cla-17]